MTTPHLLALGLLATAAFTVTHSQESSSHFNLEWVPPPDVEFKCKDENWNMIRNRCYRAFDTAATYDEALQQCKSEGGMITTPAEVQTNDELGELIGAAFWIGLQKIEGNDDYAAVLSNGEQSHLSASPGWDYQHPDLSVGDCVQNVPVDRPDAPTQTYKWQMTPCGKSLPYICETRTCTVGQYLCANGHCIGEGQVCDSADDCGDRSDEIDCPELTCTELLEGVSGTVKSPRYPSNYQSGLDCRWTIQGPVGSKISFALDRNGQTTNFNTESNSDVVDIWAGGKTISTSSHVAKLSGDLSSEPPITYVSPNNFMIITFSSDSTSQERGFSGRFNTKYSCDMGSIEGYYAVGTEVDQSGVQTNRNEATCVNSCVSDINCNSFLYEIGSRTCTFFKDVGAPSRDIDFNYWSKRCKDTIGTADSDALPGGGGERIASNVPRQILSPSYPLDYYSNLRLTWTVSSTFTIITFQIRDIDLLPGDKVTIHDGAQQSGPVLATYSGDGSGTMEYSVVMTTTDAGVVHFHSTSLGNARGFLIEYRSGCNIEIVADSGYVQSPGFGDDRSYPNVQDCSWIIQSTSLTPVSLIFNNFDVDSSDSVKVYEGIDSDGPPLHSSNGLSDSNRPGSSTYRSASGELFLQFSSDASDTGTGFEAQFSIDCRDPMFDENTNVNGFERDDVTLRKFGSSFDIQCSPGYYFSAEEFGECDGVTIGGVDVNMKCLYGGSWNYNQIPVCSRIYCGFPVTISNGFIKNVTSVLLGGEAVYGCFEGFTLNAGDTAECGSRGQWINVPTCEAHGCPTDIGADVQSPLNIMYNNTPDDSDNRAYGVVATFYCDEGYELDMANNGPDLAQPVVYCTSTDTGSAWTSEAIPTCKPVKCEVPQIDLAQIQEPAPSQVVVEPGTLVEFNTELNFRCDAGYKRNDTGNSHMAHIVKCLSDSSFGTLPFCEDMDECTESSGLCEAAAGCENTVGSYNCTCLDGYMLGGTNGRTCEDIDECAENNGGCSDECTNEPGSYSCLCPTGYSLFQFDGYNGFSTKPSETGDDEGDILHYNHTCVREICDVADDPVWQGLEHATVMSVERDFFYFEDQVEILCDIGYVIAGTRRSSTTARCKPGEWEFLDDPVCEAVMCLALELPDDLLKAPTLSSTGDVAYGDTVTLTCTDEFDVAITQQMECVYDSGEYVLKGAELECGVIDCGEPQDVPGMDTSAVDSTTYSSYFEFDCIDGFEMSGQSGSGDTTVTCTSGGYWDLGNLTCSGSTCSDPGRPPDSIQIATTYQQGQKVTFNCTRQGYKPVPVEPMECVTSDSGLVWEPLDPPECEDMEPPKFTNCEDKVAEVARFELLTDAAPDVTDNTGIAKLFPNFNLNSPVLNTTNVMWTAEDYAGNRAECNVTVTIKDEAPPNIVCPLQPGKITLNTFDEVNEISTSSANINNVDEAEAIPPAVTYEPQQFVASHETLDETFAIAFTATDTKGNSDTCYFSYVVEAAECQDWYLPEPSNGNKDCNVINNEDGRECEMTCNGNYIFFSRPGESFVYSCEKTASGGSGEWTLEGSSTFEYVPDCIERSPAVYVQEYILLYADEAGTPPVVSCFQDYVDDVNTKASQAASGLTNLCIGLTGNNDIEVLIETDENSVTVLQFLLSVTYRVVVGPDTVDASSLQQCAYLISNSVSYETISSDNSVTNDLYEVTDNGDCGARQVQDPVSPQADGFVCNGGVQQTDSDGNIVCAPCSTGYYAVNNTCELCEVGTYSSQIDMTECTPCPEGRTTKYRGANSMDLCRAQCPPGYISENGLTPCARCQADYYWQDPTHCEPCGEGRGTDGKEGIPSEDLCLDMCIPGFISYSGYAPCIPCPRGFYQENFQATDCIACDQGSTTVSLNSSSSADCTNDADFLCAGDPCSGHGDCSIADNQVNCVCNEGFTGLSCESLIDPCLSSPCYHGGECTSENGIYSCLCVGTTINMFEKLENKAVNGFPIDTVSSVPLTECQTRCTDVYACKVFSYTPATQACFIYGGEFADNTVVNFPGSNTYNVTEGTVSVYNGSRCELNKDDCENNDECSPNGMCQDTDVGFNCLCLPTFGGPRCDETQPICENQPCENGGLCKPLTEPPESANRRVCECEAGYTGTSCESNINECASNPCFYGFECVDEVGRYSCLCTDGFTGDRCEVRPDSLCAGHTCGNAGMCVDDYREGAPVCLCNDGAVSDMYWTAWYDVSSPEEDGIEDETLQTHQQFDDDLCASPVAVECWLNDTAVDFSNTNPKDVLDIACTIEEGLLCYNSNQSHSLCHNYRVRYQCEVEGVTCEQLDECNSQPCLHGGVCEDRVGDYHCDCPAGLDGHNCQHDYDECGTNPCVADGSTCIDGINSFTCQCPDGFTGTVCETNIDDCEDYCEGDNSQGCEDLVQDYKCVCNPGYTGQNCTMDIDECASDPCLHGADCTHTVDDYECSCPHGYTGKQCESLIELCEDDYCLNGGQCYNLLDGTFCACVDGTAGERCEDQPDLCDFSSLLCLNGGTCQSVDGEFECSCPDEYTGTGCQCERDFCGGDEIICMNGGICEENADGTDFTCTCLEGFMGDRCETNIDDCASLTCGNGGVCIDGVGEAFCQCPFGKSGPTCEKNTDRDFDLVFNGEGGTFQLHPFVLNSSDMTIALWGRADSGKEGTFLCLHSSESQESMDYDSTKLCIDTNGVNLYFSEPSTDSIHLPFGVGVDGDDGSWHSIVFTLDSGAEEAVVYFESSYNTLPLSDLNTEILFARLTLGGYEVPDNNADVHPLYGSVTRVFMFDRVLTTSEINDFNEIGNLDDSPVTNGLVADWDGYSLEGSVQRLLGTLLCIEGVDNGCAAGGITPPTVDGECPDDIVAVGDDEPETVAWQEPSFNDAVGDIKQNYPGQSETFNPGIYEILYLAEGEGDTSADCSFQVTVKLKDCVEPEAPFGGNAPVCGQYPIQNPFYSYCSVSCVDGSGFLEPVPNMYTCGAEGLWDVNEPSGVFNFPACGSLGTVKLEVHFGWAVTLASAATDSLLDILENQVKTKVTEWSNSDSGDGFCSDDDCSGLECLAERAAGAGDNNIVNISCTISGVPASIGVSATRNTASELDVVTALNKAALQDNEFGVSVTGAEVIDPETFFVNTVVICEPGYQDVADQCVECTVGTYYNNSRCVKCPRGQYQDETKQTECKQCSEDGGFTTAVEGSKTDADCFESCPPGQYYDVSDTEQCKDCGRGRYQSEAGETTCISCDTGMTTRQENSTSVDDCVDDCESGSSFDADGNCELCPVGTYKARIVDSDCLPCPPSFTTAGPGGESELACNVVPCVDGEYRTGSPPGMCNPCEIGFWRNGVENMESCNQCPDGFTTDMEGSTNHTDCKFYCGAGYFISRNDQNETFCEICPPNTYKAVDESDRLSSIYREECMSCPANLPINGIEGSESAEDCKYANCTSGQIVDGEECIPCEFGSYQPDPQPTNNTCILCPEGLSTVKKGADSEEDCKIACDSGKEDIEGVCTECGIGYYKDNEETSGDGSDNNAPFASCTLCPVEKITSNTGSTSESACDIVNCTAGYKRVNDTHCLPCPVDTYQDEKFQTECKACPEDYVTAEEGSTDVSACNMTPNRKLFRFTITLVNVIFTTALNDPSSDESQAIIDPMFEAISRDLEESADVEYKLLLFRGFMKGSVISVWDVQSGSSTTQTDVVNAVMDIISSGEVGGNEVDSQAGPAVHELRNISVETGLCQVHGEGYSTATGGCVPCAKNTYDPANVQTDICAACPEGLETKKNGSYGLEDTVCRNPCELRDLCNDQGTCVWTGQHNTSCTCNDGYIGFFCEQKADECNYCNKHGSCIFDSREDTFICNCDSPYEGEQCDVRGGVDDAPLIIGLVIGLFSVVMVVSLLVLWLCRVCNPKEPQYKKHRSSRVPPMAYPMASANQLYAQQGAMSSLEKQYYPMTAMSSMEKPYYPAGIGGPRQPVILGTPSQTLNQMPSPFKFYEDKDDQLKSASYFGYNQAPSFFQGQ